MNTALVYVLCAVWCCCSGYNIPECGSDGTLNVTETHSITLTCTGITGDIMGWNLLFPNTTWIMIYQCAWSTSFCRVYHKDLYEVSRTQYSTSTLTVKHTTRDSIAGSVRCEGNDFSKRASCNVRVVPATTTKTTTTSTTATKTPSSTAKPPTSTATRDTRTTNDDDDDDDDDDGGLPIPVIAGGAGGALVVIIAVVIAIVVWKNRCDPTYARPTRRSQVIDTNIYTELDPQQQDSIEQAPEEDVYEDTTGQQPAGHGTVEYVNTATGTQAAEGTVYMNV